MTVIFAPPPVLKPRLTTGNAKLGPGVWVFNVPAGWSCPSAKLCLSKADPKTGKVADGKHTKFRCYAASLEARSPALRNLVWNNFNSLKRKSVGEMADLLTDAVMDIPRSSIAVRIHTDGDFFNTEYYEAWREVARRFPWLLFYGYTKEIHLLAHYGQVNGNHRLVASYGGKQDDKIDQFGLIHSKVVMTEAEAEDLGYKIDHDDRLAMACSSSFALLLHGTQPAGSEASAALSALHKQGKTGYSRKGK